MLIEGVDDSVLSLVSLVLFISFCVMIRFFKSSFLSVRQTNPTLHRDAVNDINQEPNTHRHLPSGTQLNCPICIAETVLPIETNCGHIFCGNCIVQYWKHATANIFHSKIKCPMCRQFISCLLPLYNSRDEIRQNVPNLQEIKACISNYNRRFSGAPRPFMDYITDIPVLLRHIFNELFSFQGLEIWHRIRWIFLMIVGIVYFISPLDIIPEMVFGIFGLLDDIFVFVLLIIYITILYRQVVANRLN